MMVKILNIFIFCALMMTNMVYGQDKTVIQAVNEGKVGSSYIVQPVGYNGQDNLDRIEYMSFCQRGESYECIIKFKEREYEDGDFWSFRLKNIKTEKENIIADLSNLSVDMNNCIYADDKAFGNYKYDKNTGIETLTIHYHFYEGEDVYVISWKNLPKNKDAQ